MTQAGQNLVTGEISEKSIPGPVCSNDRAGREFVQCANDSKQSRSGGSDASGRPGVLHPPVASRSLPMLRLTQMSKLTYYDPGVHEGSLLDGRLTEKAQRVPGRGAVGGRVCFIPS